jgi:hypothetical protein
MRTIYYRVLLFIFCLPLFWINCGKTHDWGDDFAQYIIQAKNITLHLPQETNGLVFDKKYIPYAVQAYPAGFPLFLARLYYVHGLEPQAYLVILTLVLIILALLIHEYARYYFQTWLSIAIALFIVYNLQTLLLKGQILSEIPFTCLLYGILVLEKKIKSNKQVIFCGILTGMLLSFRIAGFIIIPALLLSGLLQKEDRKIKTINAIKIILSGLLVFLLLNLIIVKTDITVFLSFYSLQILNNPSLATINLQNYIDLFATSIGIPQSFIWIKWILIPIFITGLILLTKKAETGVFFLWGYLALLLFYPYTSGGFRFIFPVLPLIVISRLYALEYLLSFTVKNKMIVPILFTGLLLWNIRVSVKNYPDIKHADGPYDKEARAVFDYIKKQIPQDAVIAFSKPRALHLFTNRSTSYLADRKSPGNSFSSFINNNITYLLYADSSSSAFDPAIKSYLDSLSGFYSPVFQSNPYTLFQMKNIKRNSEKPQ